MSLFWTPDREERLHALADGTRTAAEIGKELGCSRNAVIGKIERGEGAYGRLAGRSIGLKPGQVAKPPAEPKPFVRKAQRAAPTKPPVAPPPTAPVVGATFWSATEAGTCLHFIGEEFGTDGPDMPVCGAPRTGGPLHRYCRRHTRLGFLARAA